MPAGSVNYNAYAGTYRPDSSLLGAVSRQPSLADEIAALRKEIAALREDLKPASSLILTGQDVAKALIAIKGKK